MKTSHHAAIVAEREPVQVKVSAKGLDLHSESGRRSLQGRIVRAAREACIPNGATLEMRLDALRCVREMRDDGTRQLAARAGDVRLAGLHDADRSE